MVILYAKRERLQGWLRQQSQLRSYGDKHLPYDTAVATVRKTVNALKALVHPDAVQRCYNRSRLKEKFTLDHVTEIATPLPEEA